jgi:hypothetical protein
MPLHELLLLLLLLPLLLRTWKSGFAMMSPAPISNAIGSFSLLVSLVDSSTCTHAFTAQPFCWTQ